MLKTGHFQKQEKKYSEHCCVPLCLASSKFNGVLSFHGFPTQPDLRRQWLVSIRRDKFTITSHTKVCSQHFATDQLIEPTSPDGRRRLVKGDVPTLFEWNGYTGKIPWRSVWERTERPIEPDPPEEQEQDMDVTADHDYCSLPEPSALDMSASAAEDMSKEVEDLRKEIQELLYVSSESLDYSGLLAPTATFDLLQLTVWHRLRSTSVKSVRGQNVFNTEHCWLK